ncbi:MAG: NUDIX hydrolase [Reinekea sp.]|jgi:8-oxo-dGTP pyrophosphatase MutT (NUDIX family)|nr:NUDIX hydrolase [Reinekea sp.]
MLTFNRDAKRFNFRSVAVIVKDNCVLVHKAVKEAFWTLPGGRVEFFEHAEDTVARELQEELGVTARVIRPLWFAENFFHYNEQTFHELGHYFLAEITSEVTMRPGETFAGIEPDEDLIYQWLPLTQLADIDLKPEFLHQGLRNLPSALQYVKIQDMGFRHDTE